MDIILYPRSYNKRGASHLHSVRGLTSTGQLANVKLRPKPGDGSHNTCSISELARVDRKAQMACIATETNGPDAREGVLLFQGAERDPNSRADDPSFVAPTVEVLAADASCPEPIFGPARIEVRQQSPATKRIQARVEALKESEGGDLVAEEIAALQAELRNPQNFSFPAFIYQPHRAVRMDKGRDAFLKQCASICEAGTSEGFVGGVLIRTLKDDGSPYSGRHWEIHLRFKISLEGHESGTDLMQDWCDKRWPELAAGETLEAIPFIRVNNAYRGNYYYGAPERYRHINEVFFDDHGEPMVCNCVVTVNRSQESGLHLLHRVFPISPPLCRPSDLASHTPATPAGATVYSGVYFGADVTLVGETSALPCRSNHPKPSLSSSIDAESASRAGLTGLAGFIERKPAEQP